MTDTITLTGIIATDPRALVTQSGLSITSFRLASTQRRYDRVKGEWLDGETNWYTVTAFRQLAENVLGSLRKGQRVVVTGRLRIRSWEAGDRSGMTVEVDADAIGHDLTWGTSTFERRVASASVGDRAAASDDGEAVRSDATERSSLESVTAGEASEGATTGAATSEAGPSLGGASVGIDGSGTPAGAADASDWGAPAAVGADEVLAPF
ncbi:single-stranded DNA-binding protein [Frigoribacterium sp. Leaf186]|uniref:single-stranded DNA-binding protein n=1 Tax=Frigoribacterium sp. Leaf186 TaxID=1736293 RepID=UPI0009E864DB|nr:single-stranded DNA-binding protein [Frigoribacterium sp. Leaf186]